MRDTSVAKLFRNGRSQAVRLPKEFRFEGDRVRIRRVPGGVLLQPMTTDVRRWFAEIDHLMSPGTFMPKGRRQPRTPKKDVFE